MNSKVHKGKSVQSPFIRECKRCMHFLCAEYSCQITCEDHAEPRIVFENTTTYVSLLLDKREQMTHIRIGRVPRSPNRQQRGWSHDLGDLLVGCAPEQSPYYEKHEFDWLAVLERAAKDIKTFLPCVLGGDFRLFESAQQILAAREKEYLEWSRRMKSKS